MMELRDKERSAGHPSNPVEGMRRHGEVSTALGAADTKMANAAQPLWASLNDDQKRRFPMLVHGLMRGERHVHGPREAHGPDHGAPPSPR